ncbi:MAG: hypothetical protein COV47_00420 [Candidatus Diapherotrites archaeon CG11_big_fil_rev_8_21_14_0_20_37_9]|nr:MAG: hypothetical protein COV47_00420 [Candidatus Diapherotrites archaeon CG11_big_fil_rev_8_21_14_0_20_37_9]
MTSIIICGLARSGKDAAANHLVEKYGFTKYTFSEVLKELLDKEGIEPTKENMNILGDTLRFEMGMDAIAKILAGTIQEKEKLVLVGPRSIEEVDYFRKKFPDLKIVKITAEKDNRFQRKSVDDAQEREAFFERDENDFEKKGLKRVLETADYEVKNNETLEKLKANIDLLMNFHPDLTK